MSDDSVSFLRVEVDGTDQRNAAPKQALELGEQGLQVRVFALFGCFGILFVFMVNCRFQSDVSSAANSDL